MAELNLHDVQLMLERIEFDLSYKRDQRELLCRALENVEDRILLVDPHSASRKRLLDHSLRLRKQLSTLNLELRALEVQKTRLERDLYNAGATYADLAPQWRAAADRMRK